MNYKLVTSNKNKLKDCFSARKSAVENLLNGKSILTMEVDALPE